MNLSNEIVRVTRRHLPPSLIYALCPWYVSMTMRRVSRLLRLLELLDERNVVALEQDLADLAPFLWRVFLGESDFDGVVDNEVHEFVKTPKLSLNAHTQVLVQPYRDGRS